MQDLLAFVKEREGQCGIIYVRLRKTCDWLASELQNAEACERLVALAACAAAG